MVRHNIVLFMFLFVWFFLLTCWSLKSVLALFKPLIKVSLKNKNILVRFRIREPGLTYFWEYYKPLNPKISWVILFPVYHKILLMLVWRI